MALADLTHICTGVLPCTPEEEQAQKDELDQMAEDAHNKAVQADNESYCQSVYGTSCSDYQNKNSPAQNLLALGNPYGTSNDKPYGDTAPCIQELIPNPSNPDKPTEGPDNGYVITTMEEPLNIDPSGETGKDDYVTRRCFRNSFQYYSPGDKQTHTAPILATSCSATAQKLFTDNNPDGKPNKYQVKYSCKEVEVILTKGGSSAIYGYVSMLYRWGASLVGIIAVTVIIISGIQISASGGDSEAVGSAKKRIIQSIVGILVLFLSSLILYTINPTFFVK